MNFFEQFVEELSSMTCWATNHKWRFAHTGSALIQPTGTMLHVVGGGWVWGNYRSASHPSVTLFWNEFKFSFFLPLSCFKSVVLNRIKEAQAGRKRTVNKGNETGWKWVFDGNLLVHLTLPSLSFPPSFSLSIHLSVCSCSPFAFFFLILSQSCGLSPVTTGWLV